MAQQYHQRISLNAIEIIKKGENIVSMRDRIASGKLFTDYVEGLPEDRAQAKRRMIAFNATGPDTLEERYRLITEIFGRETKVWIEPPFYFCYGTNIEIGDNCYINFNFAILN